MVRSSLNIQYQSTGVGSLPSLSEIELIRTVRGLFSYRMTLSNGRACKKYILQIPIQVTGVCEEKNKLNATKRRILINTVPDYKPIDEMKIDR